jgi:hypothetical protein
MNLMLLAQDLGTIQPPAGIPVFGNFVTAVIRFIVIIAFVAALVFLLIGAIQWIVAGGEPKATQAARGRVTAALVGLAIVVSSFVIMKLIEFFFGVSVITGGTISIPVP